MPFLTFSFSSSLIIVIIFSCIVLASLIFLTLIVSIVSSKQIELNLTILHKRLFPLEVDLFTRLTF